jgi:hypothetical protein
MGSVLVLGPIIFVFYPIEPLAHFLAGLEERPAFLIGGDMSAGARRALLTENAPKPRSSTHGRRAT